MKVAGGGRGDDADGGASLRATRSIGRGAIETHSGGRAVLERRARDARRYRSSGAASRLIGGAQVEGERTAQRARAPGHLPRALCCSRRAPASSRWSREERLLQASPCPGKCRARQRVVQGGVARQGWRVVTSTDLGATRSLRLERPGETAQVTNQQVAGAGPPQRQRQLRGRALSTPAWSIHRSASPAPTSAAIQHAAVRVFAQEGVRGGAGLRTSRARRRSPYGLVYHYFGSKEDILDSIVREHLRILENVVDSINAQKLPVKDKLAGVASFMLGNTASPATSCASSSSADAAELAPRGDARYRRIRRCSRASSATRLAHQKRTAHAARDVDAHGERYVLLGALENHPHRLRARLPQRSPAKKIVRRAKAAVAAG